MDEDKRLILYIDDDPMSRKLIGSYLEQEGYETLLAGDGTEGLQMFFQEHPDLVLLDLRMPGMNGFQVMERLERESNKIPILVLTAVEEMEQVIQILHYGAWSYVIKSLDNLTLLGEAIKKAFRELHIREEMQRYQQQLEQTMHESEFYRNQLETIFQSLPDGLLSVDSQGRIAKFNQSLQTICHWGSKIQCGVHAQELNLAESENCMLVLENVLSTGEPVLNRRIDCPFSHNQVNLVTAVPVYNATGELSGATLILKDISRQDALEESLQNRREFKNIVGKSPQMQKIYTLINQLAAVDTTVLVTGESGTGKENVVDALHYQSFRAKGPLRKVNCSALSEDLLESELFGHVKGAFTGAHKDKVGRIEAAQGGTLFLDEIGELSHRIQLKLLRFLENKEYERVGSSKPLKADVRLVTATNQDLGKKVSEGNFRQDLYYRLKVMTIHIPPLRERPQDIPLLVDYFRSHFNREFRKQIYDVSEEVMNIFLRHTWPGNVRELRHAMEHAALLCPGGKISTRHLPLELTNQSSDEAATVTAPKPATLDRKTIEHALHQAQGNKSKAASILGIHRKTLYRRIHQLGMEP